MTLLKLLIPESKTIPKCIWKDVTSAINSLNEELERCRAMCDGYNQTCQYYFTQRGKYKK